MGIEQNRWLAWQFDDAVFTFGRFIESELAERDSAANKQRRLWEILGLRPVVSRRGGKLVQVGVRRD